MNIGDLSRLTGLPVKTIRYYSDVGLVPEADRSAANYRRYDHGSLVRLEFVRTLRELGLDIATIRQVLDRDADLSSVAAAHAEALTAQIRILRLRRAALRAIARHDPTKEDLDRMTRLAQATAEERRRIIDQFFDAIFSGVPLTPESEAFASRMRGVSANLPEDPTDAQVDAWIELAELVRDEDFRAKLRTMGQTAFGSAGPAFPTGDAATTAAQHLVDKVAPVMDAGVLPSSARAAALVDEIASGWAAATGHRDNAAYRQSLHAQLTTAHEPRAERYWQLLATINGWPEIPTTSHRWAWFAEALTFTRT
jgi:DNA-binding transcriptional MerR regulator